MTSDFFQFPYYTVAPVNSDPIYETLFKQSWLADWAYYNNTANAVRGRYGLGAGPSPEWCSGGAAYVADRTSPGNRYYTSEFPIFLVIMGLNDTFSPE